MTRAESSTSKEPDLPTLEEVQTIYSSARDRQEVLDRLLVIEQALQKLRGWLPEPQNALASKVYDAEIVAARRAHREAMRQIGDLRTMLAEGRPVLFMPRGYCLTASDVERAARQRTIHQRAALERIRDWRGFRHTGEVRDCAAAALKDDE